MENEKSYVEILDGVKSLLNQLPVVSYGSNIIPYFNIPGYGSGQAGFDLLKNEFNELDLSKQLEYSDLDKKIKRQKKEAKDLENKYTSLVEIIGGNDNEGSIASLLMIKLNQEIDHLIEKRDKLLEEITSKEDLEEEMLLKQQQQEIYQTEEFNKKTLELEAIYSKKEELIKTKFEKDKTELDIKIASAREIADKEINTATSNANVKVKLINQFKDFLEETNNNMRLYNYVILCILLAAILVISLSIPNLLIVFDSYDTFIKLHSTNITNWQIINYAVGLLIVKLPWAFCLSAVLTGMYSLLKGLLLTYEKINQDKRNMSAIYAISGNVAQALNEYGISLADEGEDENTGETFTEIRVTSKGLEQKKENLRWNQIMKYFEGMQQIKIEAVPSDDSSKLKLVLGLLNKVIDKQPKENK